MNYFLNAVILTFVIVYSISGGSVINSKTLFSSHSTRKLRLVTSVEGKAYFGDDILRNWTQSGSYCNSLGMKLATILSDKQFQALNVAANETTFYSRYWTAGRDSHEVTQFSWNGSMEGVSNDFIPMEVLTNIPYQTCLAFDPVLNNKSYVFYDKCSNEWASLCETP